MQETNQINSFQRDLKTISLITNFYVGIIGMGFIIGFYLLLVASFQNFLIVLFVETLLVYLISIYQSKEINHSHFFVGRVSAINLTALAFSKLGSYAVYNLSLGSNVYHGLSLFIISQIIYHSAEFHFVLTCHLYETNWNSKIFKLFIPGFLINHSTAYNLAMACCQIEYWIEMYYFENIKAVKPIIYIGLVGVIIGQFFRISAQMTAKSNFTHLIADEKKDNHQLVTHGIYSIARHPSYLGFFLSASSNQLLLMNPICFIGFIPVLWNFFYNRIIYEEWTLRDFFGQEYVKYASKTPIWIPFIQSKIEAKYGKFE